MDVIMLTISNSVSYQSPGKIRASPPFRAARRRSNVAGGGIPFGRSLPGLCQVIGKRIRFR